MLKTITRNVNDLPEYRPFQQFDLNQEEWDDLLKLHEFLLPMDQLTKLMCAEEYPTSSLIIGRFNALFDVLEGVIDGADRFKRICTPTIIQAATKAREVLAKYYGRTNAMTMMCMALDPRVKLTYFIRHKFPVAEINAVRTLYIFHFWILFMDSI